jgi:hypothetical protein
MNGSSNSEENPGRDHCQRAGGRREAGAAAEDNLIAASEAEMGSAGARPTHHQQQQRRQRRQEQKKCRQLQRKEVEVSATESLGVLTGTTGQEVPVRMVPVGIITLEDVIEELMKVRPLTLKGGFC